MSSFLPAKNDEASLSFVRPSSSLTATVSRSNRADAASSSLTGTPLLVVDNDVAFAAHAPLYTNTNNSFANQQQQQLRQDNPTSVMMAETMPGAIRVPGFSHTESSSYFSELLDSAAGATEELGSRFDGEHHQGTGAGGGAHHSTENPPLMTVVEVMTEEEIQQRIHQEILRNFALVTDVQLVPENSNDDNDDDDPINNNLDSNEARKNDETWKPPSRPAVNTQRTLFVLFMVALLVGVAVAVSVIISNNNNKEKRNTPVVVTPTHFAPTPNSRIETFRSLLVNNSVSSDLVLWNVSSPQYRALRWLALDDPVALSELANWDIIKERFVMATLYFSTNGANWINTGPYSESDNPFLSSEVACTWNGALCSSDNLTQALLLSTNYLQGPIPPEIGHFKHLVELHLENNYLTGTLPTEIGQLTNLEYLNLFNNQLKGTIPTEIGGLQHMTDLSFGSNMLNGTVPSEMARLTSLSSLDLCYNNLSGTLLEELRPLLSYCF